MSGILKVSVVKEGFQAERIGIRPGDIVVSYDGMPIQSDLDLSNASGKAKKENKQAVQIVINRDGAEISLEASTDRLGIECLEHQSSFSLEMKVQTDYGVAKGMASIISFAGWGFVIVGALVVLVSFSQGAAGLFLALLPGLGLAVSGFLLIMGAQVTKAAVDTADYTREILKAICKK